MCQFHKFGLFLVIFYNLPEACLFVQVFSSILLCFVSFYPGPLKEEEAQKPVTSGTVLPC